MLRRISWFWVLVGALLVTSTFFAVSAEAQRRALGKAPATIPDGAIVSVLSVLDGDTVVVKTEAGESVSVRIVGIKAFKAGTGLDTADRYGQGAVAALRRATENRPVRVALNSPPKDKYGRTLATLFADDQDLGLSLVTNGLVLVYTAYPFPAMALYLREQAAARGTRRGVWADPTVVERADLLERQWRSEAP